MKIPSGFSLCVRVQLGCAGYPKKFAALFRAYSFRRKITSIAKSGIKTNLTVGKHGFMPMLASFFSLLLLSQQPACLGNTHTQDILDAKA